MKYLIYLFLISSLTLSWAEQGMLKQPNFIIVLGDDISSNTIGCYGSKNPDTTPNIDQLAAEGVRFTNMFVSQAVCGPARAELYTGLTPYLNGVVANHGKTKVGTLSVVHHLEKLGYRVGLTGKKHFGPQSVYPFEIIKGFSANCNHFGPIENDWSGVEEFMTRDDSQPFCLVIASTHAHAPWDAGDSSRWNLEDLVLPANLADTPETRHYFREYLAEVRLFDEQVKDTRELMEKHALAENTALIVLDENGTGMPGGKWTNYDWGVRSACVIKWPSLYGQPFVTDAIAQYCDILPTMIEAAGGVVPETMDGQSMLPLLTGETKEHRDYAYFIFNTGREGPPFASRAITDGRYKLIWTLTPESKFAIRVINPFDYGHTDKMSDDDRHVRKVYKSWLADAQTNEKSAALVQRFRERPEFQLFDLKNDPEEMSNLAQDVEFAEIIEKLQNQIKTLMQNQGDKGLITSKKKS